MPFAYVCMQSNKKGSILTAHKIAKMNIVVDEMHMAKIMYTHGVRSIVTQESFSIRKHMYYGTTFVCKTTILSCLITILSPMMT